ncbi:MAG: hypothetical protein ACEY3D_09650 [Rickettsia sp.]|uniref:hypothetical protein n=1 Tax=Rickettsia sp. TaxID=789 RepID=UPI00397C7365
MTTGSITTIKNTNNFSIFNWIPWSSHGMTHQTGFSSHTTSSMPYGNDTEHTKT